MQLLNSEQSRRGRKSVIVLGCGRGGTSAVAGMLRQLGVRFPGWTHPLKHESSPIVYDRGEVDFDATRANIDVMEQENSCWGWKSPRDLYFVNQWVSYVTNPHFVIVFRNVADAAASAVRYEDIPFSLAAKHVAEVYAELGRFIALMPFPIAVLSYETLCREPRANVDAIEAWLDLDASAAQVEAAADFVSRPEKGYRPLRSQQTNVRNEVSTEEFATNRASAQAALFEGVNADLQARIDGFALDMEAAAKIVVYLEEELSRRPQRQETRGEPVALEVSTTRMAEKVDSCDRLVTEQDANAARTAFVELQQRFFALVNERLALQRIINDLDFRLRRQSSAPGSRVLEIADT